jgi:hypothetical protein
MLDSSADHYHPDWWNGEAAVIGVILAVRKWIYIDTRQFNSQILNHLYINEELSLTYDHMSDESLVT